MRQTIDSHEAVLEFYRQQTPYSTPGPYANLFDGLPDDIPGVAKALQGIVIHMWWISKQTYGFTHDDLRAANRDILGEISLATTEQMIEKVLELDPQPLEQQRDATSRLIGNCRDYSLLLVSILRHRGIPARARTGVSTYFVPDKPDFEDHWICEFWNADASRWQQVDAQLDDLMISTIKLPYAPADLPSGAFLTGWQCYDEITSGRVKPELMGFGPDFNGMRYVRQKLIEDLASVTGQEVLPWAAWGIGTGGSNSEADKQVTALVAETLKQLDEPGGLQRAIDLISTHPRVRQPADYDAGRFQEAWL